MLYRQFKGEDDDSLEQSENQDGRITVNRLEEILAKCEEGGYSAVELNEEETKAFGEYVKKHADSEVRLWEPWWNSRKEFATTKVQQVAGQ